MGKNLTRRISLSRNGRNKLRSSSAYAVVALACSLWFISCVHSSSVTKDYGEGAYQISGTMHHINLEGGCWQFISDKNVSYELLGDHITELFHDGIGATLVVKDRPNIKSICMIGKPVEVLAVLNLTQ
ncbi:MAG TPA: hypothetical protein VKI62_00230 [Bacteroidota bacterium]|nr:hypothetical protein [Bacteroidota bacterium]